MPPVVRAVNERLAPTAVIPDDLADSIARFDRDGFIGPVKLYEPDEATAMLRQVRIKNQRYQESIYRNQLNYDRHLDINELTGHMTHPTIIRHLGAILGPDLLLWRSEFFAKFPGSVGTEWHQVRDYSYANGEPQLQPTDASWNAYIDITVWTTFTPATVETGCMRFVKGSHRQQVFDEHKPAARGRGEQFGADYEAVFTQRSAFYGYEFSDFLIDPAWNPSPQDVVDVEMAPGEALIFTAACVHGSHPNTTDRETRFAIVGRYVPTHVRVYPDQDRFAAHGVVNDLTDYGSVLVAGSDRYGHNRLRTTNNHGTPFVHRNVEDLIR